MTSERKIRANQANARASTGPKTAPGRTRAARNAFRHGLSLPVVFDSALAEEIERLAGEIAGPDANIEIQELARYVAEAQIDLRRIRHARHHLLSHALNDRHYASRANGREKVKLMYYLMQGNAPEKAEANQETFVTSAPEGAQKFTAILLQETKRLLAMDRYEARALSRRRVAIRVLDEARRRID